MKDEHKTQAQLIEELQALRTVQQTDLRAALDERTRELDCLIELGRVVEDAEGAESALFLERVARILPRAVRHAEAAVCRIQHEDVVAQAGPIEACTTSISAPLLKQGRPCGSIEIGYTADFPDIDEGPFTREERRLLGAVAERVSRVIERRQAQADLLAARDNMQALVDDSADGIVVTDAQGAVLYANPKATEIFARLGRPVIGTDMGLPTAWQHPVEMQFLATDGRRVPVEVWANKTTFEGRSAVRMSIRDVSELRAAERALRDSEQKHRELFETMAQGVVYQNADGEITVANPAAERLLGLSLEQMQGRTSIDPRWRAIHEDGSDFPGSDHPAMVALRTGKPVRDVVMGIYNPERDEHRWILVSSMPQFLSGEDTPYQAFSTFEDITEHELAERALAESERKFRAIADNTVDCIWAMTLDFEFTYVNPAVKDIFGYAPDAFLGTNLRDHCSGERFEEMRALVAKTIESGNCSNVALETEWRDSEGNGVPVEIHGSVVCDDDGHATSLQGVARDTRERANLEAQLRQSQKMEAIGQLAGGVAHDFNNILTGIGGFTRFAFENPEATEDVRQDLHEVIGLTKRAQELTRQLLAFSRKQALRIQPINLNNQVSGLLKMLGRLIGENIALEFQPASDLSPVKADPSQIEQILMNLVVNARDAMPEGGDLLIETKGVLLDEEYAATHESVVPGPYVCLSVSDTGVGMDPTTRERAFDPFFTTKEKGKGTGLGLATVYGIVKQHGGNIWLYSEPGHGTTIRVYLPMASDEPISLETRETPVAGGDETLLVAEDEPSVSQVAKRYLEARGYRVLTADSASEAEEILSKSGKDIALLLTDVVMPDRSGRQLFEEACEDLPHLKVVYMSGYTDDAIIRHGIIEGGAPLIEKPFTPDDLARVIRTTLDR